MTTTTLEKLTLPELEYLHRCYVDSFDPSPRYAFDGFLAPLDFADWLECPEEGFLHLCELEGYDPESVSAYWEA